MKEMKGLYTALITPFTQEGLLDREGLRRNLRFQLHNNVDGVVVLGTTGEAPTLSPEEKDVIIEIALEELKGKVAVFVGTGTYSTETTIATTKKAMEMGADGALVVTPYYNKPTQEGLFRHFAALCEALPSFPLCIYNIQGRTGQNLQTETLHRLMNFPSIIAVKEASGNIMQMGDVIAVGREQITGLNVLAGDDALTIPLIALGGHGVISVAGNLLPGPMKKMVNAALEGNFESARKLHFQMLPFFKSNFIETNPIPIKAAMSLCGMAAGPCRLPLCGPEPSHLNDIQTILHSFSSLGLLHLQEVYNG